MARLLPIPGNGVPGNVITDFSTEAAFLFLSSSSTECHFSVGDSLAFTEKMTSIWFAFTPPEEGIYSLYIFHQAQEVGAAEFDVYLPGFQLEDGMLPEGSEAYNSSTLRGLTCEIDGLEEFVKVFFFLFFLFLFFSFFSPYLSRRVLKRSSQFDLLTLERSLNGCLFNFRP